MNQVSILLLSSPKEGGGSGMGTLLMFGMIIIVFYFFMIRPQQKKTKNMKKFREALKKGDHIVTIGGIHGKIADLKETTVVIDTEGGKIKLERSAISMEFSSQSIEEQAK